MTRAWLVAEHCDHEFLFCGWHLYVRDHREPRRRNADNDWGWIRGFPRYRYMFGWLQRILDQLGIIVRGDGSCDDDGYAEIARRWPDGRRRVGGRPRGCVPLIDQDGSWIIDPEWAEQNIKEPS